mgnify:CR=1 FL=1
METQSFFYKNIAVDITLRTHSVHIYFTEKLWQTMLPHYRTASLQIAEMIKVQFYQKYHKNLLITTKSLALELLGHILAYKLLQKFKKYFPFLINKQLYHAVKSRALQIDCGEKGHDKNRWFWDFFALFFPAKKSSRW